MKGSLWSWFKQLVSGKPHFFIGGEANPYLKRWFLIPRNHFLNIYLHQFLRDDDDRACHDHPWWFISIMVRGCYYELTPAKDKFSSSVLDCRKRTTPSIGFRRAEHRHIVKLEKDKNGSSIPCWTIVITGRKSRVWGFWCPKGFIPWYDFVDQNDKGNVGKGCGE